MDSKSLNDDYFIRNAILCFLHYYPNHKWSGIYEELAKRESYTNSQSSGTQPKPRAARRRKPTKDQLNGERNS